MALQVLPKVRLHFLSAFSPQTTRRSTMWRAHCSVKRDLLASGDPGQSRRKGSPKAWAADSQSGAAVARRRQFTEFRRSPPPGIEMIDGELLAIDNHDGRPSNRQVIWSRRPQLTPTNSLSALRQIPVSNFSVLEGAGNRRGRYVAWGG